LPRVLVLRKAYCGVGLTFGYTGHSGAKCRAWCCHGDWMRRRTQACRVIQSMTSGCWSAQGAAYRAPQSAGILQAKTIHMSQPRDPDDEGDRTTANIILAVGFVVLVG